MKKDTDEWSFIIKPKTKWFDIQLKEVWQYRDLIVMFLKRNFNSAYKQTILGPLWFIISPLVSTSMFTLIFGKIVNIYTDGVPQFLFYLCGNTAWGYFSACLGATSSTFTGNAHLFGKVYFPRLVSPITSVLYSLLSLCINLILLAISMVVFGLRGQVVIPNRYIILLPLMVMQMALLGMGIGIIISSITTKYRDLSILVGFGMQLWLYATPVVYPISQATMIDSKLAHLIMLNPVAPIVNNFRYALLGCGEMVYSYWILSWVITALSLFLGILIFSKVEKTFMDTV